ARRVSSAPASATNAMVSPVPGSVTGNVRPDWAGCHWPFTNSPYVLVPVSAVSSFIRFSSLHGQPPGARRPGPGEGKKPTVWRAKPLWSTSHGPTPHVVRRVRYSPKAMTGAPTRIKMSRGMKPSGIRTRRRRASRPATGATESSLFIGQKLQRQQEDSFHHTGGGLRRHRRNQAPGRGTWQAAIPGGARALGDGDSARTAGRRGDDQPEVSDAGHEGDKFANEPERFRRHAGAGDGRRRVYREPLGGRAVGAGRPGGGSGQLRLGQAAKRTRRGRAV